MLALSLLWQSLLWHGLLTVPQRRRLTTNIGSPARFVHEARLSLCRFARAAVEPVRLGEVHRRQVAIDRAMYGPFDLQPADRVSFFDTRHRCSRDLAEAGTLVELNGSFVIGKDA